jgi:S-(hydroxymethyl)glutathione dehydrogenase/alcohol dehydrogenase
MGSNRFRIDMPQYVEWYLAGKLKLDELVSATMPLDKINEGFAALKGGEVARQLVTFD